MRRIFLFLGAVVLVGTGITLSAYAQTPGTSSSRPLTLGDRLDRFGQQIFGDLFGDSSTARTHYSPRPTHGSPNSGRAVQSIRPSGSTPVNTGSSALDGMTSQRYPLPRAATGAEASPEASKTPARKTLDSPKRSLAAAATQPAKDSEQPIRTSPSTGGASSSEPSGGDADTAETRLYQRLSTLRKSVFSGAEAENVEIDESAQDAGSAVAEKEPPRSLSEMKLAAPEPAESGLSAPGEELPRGKSPAAAVSSPAASATARRAPVAGKYATDAGRQQGTGVHTNPHTARTATPPAGDPGKVLFARKSPVLSVETIGPPKITVAKESAYVMTIRNSGDVAAEQVTVTLRLPTWAEITGTEASKGTVVPAAAVTDAQELKWRIEQLGASNQEQLVLRIVPRESQPIDLAVAWDYTPAASQTKIVVQQPEVTMHLDGPRQVLFGKPEVYRLELRNTGTAAAENLELSLLPLGTLSSMPVTHQLGTLAAGEQRIIEVEMTGRQTGTLNVKVDLRGEPAIEAHLDQAIVVLRPELKIAIAAPAVRYVGTRGSWAISVSNTGTAPAEDITVTARIPDGAKYVSSTAGGQPGLGGNEVIWTLDSLGVGAEQALGLTCSLGKAGSNHVTLRADAEGDVTATADAATLVEAIADLALEVGDPTGPISVGTEVEYQVEVVNRGTKEAENVAIFGYFSNGIEPTSAQGAAHQINPGQVAFNAVPLLEPGQKIAVTIRARAESAGTHVFRAEVQCPTVGAPLVQQETTHFYGEDVGALGSLPSVMPGPSPEMPTDAKPIRTAERPEMTGTPHRASEAAPVAHP